MADIFPPPPGYQAPCILDVEVLGGRFDGARQTLFMLNPDGAPRYLVRSRRTAGELWDAPPQCDPAALAVMFHVFERTGRRSAQGFELYRPWRNDGHRPR
jgi:hypothetical protein